jgi:hypothetical protein
LRTPPFTPPPHPPSPGKPAHAGIHDFRAKQRKNFFFCKKEAKKLSIPPASERPQFGRSTAGGNRSFLARSPRALFFKKALLSSGFT